MKNMYTLLSGSMKMLKFYGCNCNPHFIWGYRMELYTFAFPVFQGGDKCEIHGNTALWFPCNCRIFVVVNPLDMRLEGGIFIPS